MPILSYGNPDLSLKAQNVQRLRLVLALRLGLFAVELGAGLWSRSLSLLAGAGHLFSDLLTLGLTLLVVWLVQRQPKEQATDQYRQLYAWIALLNGLSLGTIAFVITWQSIQHLQAPEFILGGPMLVVALLSLIISGFSTYLLHEDHHRELSVRGVFLHSAADAVGSLGVVLSALVIYYWQWLWADAVASLFVAGLIGWSAISLLKDSFQVLMNARG